MDSVWAALGIFISGGALAWAIFTFFINKRDKVHDDEKSRFYKSIYEYEDRQEKNYKYLTMKFEDLNVQFQRVTLELALQKEKYEHMTERFTEYVKKVDKILDKQSGQLEYLGKIINVGK